MCGRLGVLLTQRDKNTSGEYYVAGHAGWTLW